MPSIRGIVETAISVRDVRASAEWYRRLFGFKPLLEGERLVALAVGAEDVLLIFTAGGTSEPFPTPGGVIPGHAGGGVSHLAFAMEPADVAAWRARLAGEGVTVESAVDWPGGAQSLYFRDPDGHLVELITPGFWRSGNEQKV